MNDLSFLDLNLTYKIKDECYQLFLELRKNYFNIQFSNIIFLYLWNLNKINFLEITNTIVVFKDLPKFLQPIIKNLFLLKENINISHFIRYHELETYLLQEDVSLIITFENVPLTSNYLLFTIIINLRINYTEIYIFNICINLILLHKSFPLFVG